MTKKHTDNLQVLKLGKTEIEFRLGNNDKYNVDNVNYTIDSREVSDIFNVEHTVIIRAIIDIKELSFNRGIQLVTNIIYNEYNWPTPIINYDESGRVFTYMFIDKEMVSTLAIYLLQMSPLFNLKLPSIVSKISELYLLDNEMRTLEEFDYDKVSDTQEESVKYYTRKELDILKECMKSDGVTLTDIKANNIFRAMGYIWCESKPDLNTDKVEDELVEDVLDELDDDITSDIKYNFIYVNSRSVNDNGWCLNMEEWAESFDINRDHKTISVPTLIKALDSLGLVTISSTGDDVRFNTGVCEAGLFQNKVIVIDGVEQNLLLVTEKCYNLLSGAVKKELLRK